MCVCVCTWIHFSGREMGSVGAERRRPTPAQTPEDRDVWRDGVRAGWRDGQRESWREGRESGVVQSYSFDSYQLEEEEMSKDAPERGVLALSEPGERAADPLLLLFFLKCRFSVLSGFQLLSFPQTVTFDSACCAVVMFVATANFGLCKRSLNRFIPLRNIPAWMEHGPKALADENRPAVSFTRSEL